MPPFKLLLLALLLVATGTTVAAAQSMGGMSPNRPLTARDFTGGGFSTSFDDGKPDGEGRRTVTQHMNFPLPMKGYPAIFLSVNSVDAETKTGHVGYSVSASEPACSKAGTPDMVCGGFDLTITEAEGTHINGINVMWMALNIATVADVGVTLEGQPGPAAAPVPSSK